MKGTINNCLNNKRNQNYDIKIYFVGIMPRCAFKIEYDGSPFRGWQKQKNQLTVQGVINEALLKLDQSCTGVIGAGRTDAGVHALGQVGHADLQKDWKPTSLANAINFHVKPYPITITKVVQVGNDFHARFSASKRYYIYLFLVRSFPQVFNKSRFWTIKKELDISRMKKASDFLIGTHDFQTFRSSLCQSKSSIKTIDKIEIKSTRGHILNKYEKIISIRVEARSFLHNQVRSIVGCLFKIGNKAWDIEKMKEILELKDRKACGPVAPPEGLYLEKVHYEGHLF